MSLVLAPLVEHQFFGGNTANSASNVPLAGGLLAIYAAGTSTPVTTWTTSAGSVANSNPLTLDSTGRLPNEVWWTAGSSYKLVLMDALSNPIPGASWDNVPGLSDPVAAGLTASTIPYTPPGTGAVATTVAAELSHGWVSVFDWFTPAQISDVQARTLTQDVTSAVQAAINSFTLFSYPLGGWTLYFPPGTYKITSSLVISINAFQWRLTGSWGARLQMSGSSFDLLTFGAQTPSSIVTVYNGVVDNLGFDGGSIIGTGNLINTQYASSTQFRDLLLTNLCTNGDGIHIIGNGSVYTHDILCSNIYYNSTTGNRVIYAGPTCSDSVFDRVKGNGQFGCKYGIYFDAGSAHCHVSNSHPYGHSLNACYVGANSSAHWFIDCRFENGTQDSVQLNGATNCSFSGCMFTYAPATYSDLLLTNSVGNRFVNSTFTATPSVTQNAIKETGTSNNNAFNGFLTEGSFVGSPPFVLVGSTSAIRSSGTDLTVSGSYSITAGSTAYIGNGPGNSTEASAQVPCILGGYVTQMIVQCSAAPGAGQSFTATVRVNGVSTGMVATISGASSFSTQVIGVIFVAAQQVVDVQIVASAGAAASTIRTTMIVNQ